MGGKMRYTEFYLLIKTKNKKLNFFKKQFNKDIKKSFNFFIH